MCVIRRFTHRPPGNGESDASIAFWLRKGHSAGKPLPQLAIREDAKFFVQNWTKKLFFANKDPKNNFDDWMILQKHVLSFKCNDFFLNGKFEGDVIFCHLSRTFTVDYSLGSNWWHVCLASERRKKIIHANDGPYMFHRGKSVTRWFGCLDMILWVHIRQLGVVVVYAAQSICCSNF